MDGPSKLGNVRGLSELIDYVQYGTRHTNTCSSHGS